MDEILFSYLEETQGKKNGQNLSHFNLLLRHGSQLIAFRARFVGGRPSVLCSAEAPEVGEVLPRTTPPVDDLAGFWRVGEVCKDEGGFDSDIMARGEEEDGGWKRGGSSGSKTLYVT